MRLEFSLGYLCDNLKLVVSVGEAHGLVANSWLQQGIRLSVHHSVLLRLDIGIGLISGRIVVVPDSSSRRHHHWLLFSKYRYGLYILFKSKISVTYLIVILWWQYLLLMLLFSCYLLTWLLTRVDLLLLCRLLLHNVRLRLCAFSMLGVQLLNIEHLKSLAAHRTQLLVNCIRHIHCHELKETASIIWDWVGLSSSYWKSFRNIVHSPISNFLDLHQDRDDLANFTSEVVLENTVCQRMENHYQCSQVPLLWISFQLLVRHQSLCCLDKVLTSWDSLKPINHVQT